MLVIAPMPARVRIITTGRTVTVHIDHLGPTVAASGDSGPRRAAQRAAQNRAIAPTQLGAHASTQRAAQRAAQYRISCQAASQQWRRRPKRGYKQQ